MGEIDSIPMGVYNLQYMSLLKLYKYHKLRFFSIFLKKTLDKALAM